ncbi:hypothetical protein A2W14_02575 [Candidatus Gottesmanbacteria bacterium RBG_16_37_8]|uniref:DUF4832 domain-containing protein n=1 Tax=Candidatus Gottesmanbacteria bacterium RBG_16_37_8 TaxID=1798371 RepID=A0A1F5YQQ2_9BACT|nr:MAG: hypothetical protein A2W14_02575 [Candidatus Gottesmanbacteria bacterium RBG_16_37_8]
MHWSFLHNGYSKVVLDTWVNQGCMPEVRRRLGYRFELTEALIPPTVKVGGSLALNIKLKNVGFTSMFNLRPVILVLSGTNRYEIPLPNVDPRRWQPGQDSNIAITISLPQNISPGSYKLGLWLPDASLSLKNNPAYAVRFANLNVWDAQSGINFLTSVNVQP